MPVTCAGSKCKKTILRSDQSIQCSACTRVYHIAKKCSDVELADHTYLKTENKLAEWRCQTCITTRQKSIPNFDGSFLDRTFDEQESGDKSDNSKSSMSLSKADLLAIKQVVSDLIKSELPTNFKKNFDDLSKSVKNITEEFDVLKKETESNKNSVALIDSEIVKLKNENSNLKSEIISLQAYSRRDNIIITGITQTANESLELIFNKLSSVIQSQLSYEHLSTAHRLPTKEKGKISPIVVKFAKRQEKESWLNNFKKLVFQDPTNPGISSKILANSLPETKIFANHHLAPALAVLLQKTKDLAKPKGYNYIVPGENKIIVKHSKDSRVAIIISSQEDLTKIQ